MEWIFASVALLVGVHLFEKHRVVRLVIGWSAVAVVALVIAGQVRYAVAAHAAASAPFDTSDFTPVQPAK